MIVKHLFFSLMERLNGIEQEWSNGSTQPDKLNDEIMELRKVSDDILDHWLVFEERMSKIQRIVTGNMKPSAEHSLDKEDIWAQLEDMPDHVADKILEEVKKVTQEKSAPSQVVSMLSGEAVHFFRKGQGYYSLLMYNEAASHFGKVVEQEPDLDVARMFLAYSQMMSGELEVAEQNFHLLSHTSNHGLLKATALNAEGCIAAVQGRNHQALVLFEKAYDINPKLKDPLFNKALLLSKMRRYTEAKTCWVEYTESSPNDWEALIQLARCYQEAGDDEASTDVLEQVILVNQDQEVLLEAGKTFEDLRQFGNAALCYQLMVGNDPSSAIGWHGLGWNLWHAEGLPDSIDYIKRAISLSPRHPDYHFSYGWILFQTNRWDEAEEVFKHILQQEGEYPLALAGLIHVSMAKENWHQAEHYCHSLMASEDTQTQALGHLQLGRLYLMQGEYDQAEQQLQQSIEKSPEMKDSFLWLGLIWYTLGDKEKAKEAWEHTL